MTYIIINGKEIAAQKLRNDNLKEEITKITR